MKHQHPARQAEGCAWKPATGLALPSRWEAWQRLNSVRISPAELPVFWARQTRSAKRFVRRSFQPGKLSMKDCWLPRAPHWVRWVLRQPGQRVGHLP